MNQIYKFSDPSSGFIHYILSRDIKKNLTYLNYLFQNFTKDPNGAIQINSPLVRYLMESKKPFSEITMELVFETEDKSEAENLLAVLKATKHEVVVEEQSVAEEVAVTPVSPEIEPTEKPVTIPKKRGRKKKSETVVA